MIGAESLGVTAEQQEDVGVSAGQRCGPQVAGVVGDQPARTPGAQHRQPRLARRRLERRSGQLQQCQVILDGDHRGAHPLPVLAGWRSVAAGDVDSANERTGTWIVDGHRGATPRLHDAGEMFVAADLQLGVQGQGGTGSVGAGAPLAPVGTGHEIHRRRPPARCGHLRPTAGCRRPR